MFVQLVHVNVVGVPRRYPVFVMLYYEPPIAGKEMYVNREKKYHFEEAENCFHVLAGFKEANNLIESGNSPQFKYTKQFYPWYLALSL